MCFKPVWLRQTDVATCFHLYDSLALELAPSTPAEFSIEKVADMDARSPSNDLNVCDIAENLKVQIVHDYYIVQTIVGIYLSACQPLTNDSAIIVAEKRQKAELMQSMMAHKSGP